MKRQTKLIYIIFTLLFFFTKGYCQDFNAKFIKCIIPDTVVTDSVFEAHIYMKNTGTAPWPSSLAIYLASVAPSFNYNWGTYFIIMGQTGQCAPGDTFDFKSDLRAPHTPGNWAFQWQCNNYTKSNAFKDATAFFGDTTKGVIHIKQRLEQRPSPSLHKASMLDSSDLEYIGSFGLPEIPGFDNHWTQSGITVRNMPSGSPHLFMNTGTYQTSLYEVEIPQLVKIVDGDYSKINTAGLVKNWGTLNGGTAHGEELTSNSGLWWDNNVSLLYWCHFNGYYTGNNDNTYGFPSLSATKLNENGTMTNIKSWYLPISKIGIWKGFWSGVTKLSKNFAQTYTEGKDMAVGFGGLFSVQAACSRGPALAAIATPDISKDTLDFVEMLGYRTIKGQAARRDGDYFAGFPGLYWSESPDNPWTGKYTKSDDCRAGIFIDLPDVQGYMAFPSLSTGRLGYDYGGYTFDAHSTNAWYFYDLKDLGAAAQGQKDPGTIQPSSYCRITYPADASINSPQQPVSGVCFDSTTRTIYIYEQWALGTYPAGYPVVHAYRVKVNPEVAGTKEFLSTASIQIYPNPFNTSFNISIPKEITLTDAGIQIYDVCGKEIKNISLSSYETTIERSGLQSGIYFYSITNNHEKIANGKLAVQ